MEDLIKQLKEKADGGVLMMFHDNKSFSVAKGNADQVIGCIVKIIRDVTKQSGASLSDILEIINLGAILLDKKDSKASESDELPQ